MGNNNKHPLQLEAERLVRAGLYPVEWYLKSFTCCAAGLCCSQCADGPEYRIGFPMEVRTQYHAGLDCFRVIISDVQEQRLVTLTFRNVFAEGSGKLENLMLAAAERQGIRLARDHRSFVSSVSRET